MSFMNKCLAGVLITSLALGAVGASASILQNPKAEGAGAERDRGRELLRLGHAGEALVHLENALKAFRASGDRAGEASTRDLLGELYEQQGRYDLAQEHYTTAQTLYAAGSQSAMPTAPLGGRLPGGRVTADVSEGSSAAVGLSAGESAYNARLMLAKIGNMLYRRGEYDEARAVFTQMNVEKPDTSAMGKAKRAKGILGALGGSIGSDDRSIRIGAPNLGGLLTLRDQLNFYRQSILYAGHELGLGRVDYRQEQFEEARRHFENVLAATGGDLPGIGKLGQTRRFRAAARTSLGDVAFRQGDYKKAEELYEKAAKGAREDRRDDLVWPALRGQGRALLRQAAGERDRKKSDRLRDKALDSYREALVAVEKIRQGGVRADESRTTFLATTGEVFEEAAAALAEAALSTQSSPGASLEGLEGPALAYASEALSTVERGRARSLLDLLNESGAEITEGVPAELLREKRENQTRQSEIAAELTGVELGGAEKKKKPEELEAELDELQVRFDSIENRIRAQSPRYAQLTAARTLTLDDVRRQVLDEDTALLEYSLGEERSYLFAVTRGGVSVARLPGREEVGRLVVEFRRQLIPTPLRRSITDLVAAAVDPQRGLKLSAARADANPAAVRAYADAAHALYKAAVEPAAPLFKRSRLLVVADGALNYVPFHALVTQAPAEGADFASLEYLLKKNETVFAPSASVVAAIRQQRTIASTTPGNMLVVADPVFDATDSRAVASAGSKTQPADAGRAPGFESAVGDVAEDLNVASLQSAAGGRRVALVRLAGTRAEAEQIKSSAERAGRRADVWLGLDANESELEARDLRGYRVLHFATHGLLNAERPQFTGVVLSLVGNHAGTDGFLRTDEVFNLRLGSPLVMLSACETGLGREKRGEGVMGLARAFMYAGAPTVGVTLWSVADKPTADLMSSFYQNLLAAQPTTPSAAMHAARLSLLARKETSAPYFWAPFVLVGDWK